MLQTINYWDFGPDMTGDITHPEYPNHLRKRCGEHLPHLVRSDHIFKLNPRWAQMVRCAGIT